MRKQYLKKYIFPYFIARNAHLKRVSFRSEKKQPIPIMRRSIFQRIRDFIKNIFKPEVTMAA